MFTRRVKHALFFPSKPSAVTDNAKGTRMQFRVINNTVGENILVLERGFMITNSIFHNFLFFFQTLQLYSI